MQPTYTVLGADGNQYGPITLEQFRAWIREGRVNHETQVWRSDSPAWVSASSLPELGLSPAIASAPVAMAFPGVGTAAMPGIAVVPTAADPAVEHAIKRGTSWFYWIGAFSVVNSILALTGAGWTFAIGLGVRSVLDDIANGFGDSAGVVAVALNLVAAAFVASFGYFAGKRHTWAFILGMILLGLDTVVVALTGLRTAWISLALHIWALVSIFKAFQIHRNSPR